MAIWHYGLRRSFIDYTRGLYFVTAQTHWNQIMFGTISHGSLSLNDMGLEIAAYWKSLEKTFPHSFRMDEFVLMPNHFHALVRILQNPLQEDGGRKSLPDVMRRFKSYTTVKIYRPRRLAGLCPDIGPSLWQPGYYDSLVLGDERREQITRYIRENPENWEDRRYESVTTHMIGDRALLNASLLAYVASDISPFPTPLWDPSWAGVWAIPPRPGTDTRGLPVISTFTSRPEKAVLRRCLAAGRLFIWLMPAGIPDPGSLRGPSLTADALAAAAAGRGLVMSPSEPGTPLTKSLAVWCNTSILEQAAAVRTGPIRPGGTLENLLKMFRQ